MVFVVKAKKLLHFIVVDALSVPASYEVPAFAGAFLVWAAAYSLGLPHSFKQDKRGERFL